MSSSTQTDAEIAPHGKDAGAHLGRLARQVTAWAGIIGNLCHLPLTLVVLGIGLPHIPDLSSAQDVYAYFDAHPEIMKLGILAAAFGIPFYLWMSAVTNSRLRSSNSNPMTWFSVGSEYAFWITYVVSLGCFAAGELLHKQVGPEVTLALFGLGALIAAPLTFVALGYFIAFLALNRKQKVYPNWVNYAAMLALVGNLGMAGGLFATSGPLNPINGWIGAIIPILTYGVFAECLSIAFLRQLRRGGSI